MADTTKPAQSKTQHSSDALSALVRLLARQAAREVLAEAKLPAEVKQDPLPETTK